MDESKTISVTYGYQDGNSRADGNMEKINDNSRIDMVKYAADNCKTDTYGLTANGLGPVTASEGERFLKI